MPGPTIRAELCAHQRIAQASCRACVDACPHQAWQMHADGLGFDPEACEGCGLCVAACPHGALAMPAPMPVVSEGPPRTLRMACERVPAPGPRSASRSAAGRMPCIHALTVDILLRWTRQHGAQALQLGTGDCAECPHAPPEALGALWDRWTRIAARSQADLPRLQHLSPAQWQASVSDTPQPDPRRRQFFRRLLTPGAAGDTGIKDGHALHTQDRRALITLLAEHAPQSAAAPLWWVAVEPSRCTACLACQAICLHEAFKLDAQETWTLSMSTCTGCGLCVDLCESAALTLHGPEHPRPGPPQQFPLERQSCPACQTLYRRLAQTASQAPLRCPTCEQGRPARTDRLVQADPPPRPKA